MQSISKPVLFQINYTHIKLDFAITWDKIGRIKTGRTSDVTGVSSPIVILYKIVYLTATTTDTDNRFPPRNQLTTQIRTPKT